MRVEAVEALEVTGLIRPDSRTSGPGSLSYPDGVVMKCGCGFTGGGAWAAAGAATSAASAAELPAKPPYSGTERLGSHPGEPSTHGSCIPPRAHLTANSAVK